MFCTCNTTYQAGDQFTALPIPDVDLYIYDANNNPIDFDTDQFLTVEHLFGQLPASGQYKIILRRNNETARATNYGLAWWFGGFPGLSGDYNNDGNVDSADYVVWHKDPASFGGAGGYDTWRNDFGAGTGGGTSLASVSEPPAIGLLMVGLAICAAIVTTQKLRRMNY